MELWREEPDLGNFTVAVFGGGRPCPPWSYLFRRRFYPTSLEDLIPDYLSSLPIDWFDGQSLKYRLLSEGQYLLYSVGENGTDDGGDANAKDKSAKVFFDKGRDLVWPRPQK